MWKFLSVKQITKAITFDKEAMAFVKGKLKRVINI